MDKWKDDIDKYIRGKLTPAERHALEKEALNNPFLADALEGAEQISAELFSEDVNELNNKIIDEKKNRWLWPLRIAASVIGIAVISTIIIYTTDDASENLASNQVKKEEQAPAETKADSSNQSLAQSGDTDEPKPVEPDEKKSENLVAALKDVKPETTESGKRLTVREKEEENIVSETQSSVANGAGGAQSNPTLAQNTSGPAVATDTIGLSGLASTTTTTAPLTLSIEDDLTGDVDKTDPALKPKISKNEGRVSRAKLTSTEALPISTIQITGIVRDQQGQPIPGVNIVAKGSVSGTTTNTDGKYSIEVPDKDQVLEYSFIGYISQTQPIEKSKTANLDVNLSEDVTQLSEVVVTGYGQKKDSDEPVVRLAEPLGGRKAYDKYLEERKLYPQQALDNKVEGRVVLEFTVGVTGVLSDFSVIRKLGYGCDEEVIRLVKEGPQWRPSYIDNEAVESLVRIKTRFELPGK